jgi:hypothetical protein
MMRGGFEKQGLEGRNGTIWRDHVIGGLTLEAAGEKHGISPQRVHQIIREVRANMPEFVQRELLQDSLERNADARRRLLELAEMKGVPVTAGKDGAVVMDPESNTVVRDYALRLKALELMMRADDQLAKRMGLDSPTKVESAATVRYEIGGLNDADLT